MRFWIGVASKEHVKIGVAGGFCQLCHGKAQPLNRMSIGDWIVYYSAKEKFDEAVACQQFTAIGEVIGDGVYTQEMAPGFTPYRRTIRFVQSRDIDIRPLIEQLSFIKNKTRWGYAFRFGYLQIAQADFELIARQMLSTDSSLGTNRESNQLVSAA